MHELRRFKKLSNTRQACKRYARDTVITFKYIYDLTGPNIKKVRCAASK